MSGQHLLDDTTRPGVALQCMPQCSTVPWCVCTAVCQYQAYTERRSHDVQHKLMPADGHNAGADNTRHQPQPDARHTIVKFVHTDPKHRPHNSEGGMHPATGASGTQSGRCQRYSDGASQATLAAQHSTRKHDPSTTR